MRGRAGEALARIEIDSRAALREWLNAHHATSPSVWIVTWKKGDDRYLDYGSVVEELLAFGWIDSLPRKLDAARTMLLASPRKPKSAWSALNKARIARMADAGLMAPAGDAAVARAQSDGSWTALDEVEKLVIPDDLDEAFAGRAGAHDGWGRISRSLRRGTLEWIMQAKTPGTRTKRIAATAECAAQGLPPPPFQKKSR